MRRTPLLTQNVSHRLHPLVAIVTGACETILPTQRWKPLTRVCAGPSGFLATASWLALSLKQAPHALLPLVPLLPVVLAQFTELWELAWESFLVFSSRKNTWGRSVLSCFSRGHRGRGGIPGCWVLGPRSWSGVSACAERPDG